MVEDKAAGESYTMGNVGNNARVMQGKYQNWVEAVNNLPDGNALRQQFQELLEEISNDKTQNEAEKSISKNKTEEIAKSLANAQNSPQELEIALTDGRNWFSRKASWVWNKLSDILKSETAQKTIGTITESGVKGAIQGLLG
jgi:NAD-specific glutamate dehydrogenase